MDFQEEDKGKLMKGPDMTKELQLFQKDSCGKNQQDQTVKLAMEKVLYRQLMPRNSMNPM